MKTAIIPVMKFVAALVMIPMMAFGAVIESMPQSEYADTEASTNLAFQVDFGTMSRIEFIVSLVVSPSNAVEISIGTDSNEDGNLSLGEMDQTFGCNCGHWFQRDAAGDSEKDEGTSSAGGRVEKTFILKKRRIDPEWDMVKVVRRGMATVGEIAIAEGKKPGVLLIMR